MDKLFDMLQANLETLWMLFKVVLVLAMPLSIAGFLVWAERRGSAMIQDRIGPNRAAVLGLRLLGFPQLVADGIKAFLKEDLVPPHSDRLLFFLAPLFAFIPAALGFAVIPFGQSFQWQGKVFHCSMLNPGNGMGMLLPMAVGSMAVYGLLVAAWSSNNKWSILGGMRASAQMVSFELAMTLALLTVFMRCGSYDPHDIVASQARLWHFIPQFVGFLVFFVCLFAETNRLPFDFAEGESEIVAGYLTEFGGMKFALMYLSEYANIVTAAALVVTLYWGGWQVPFVSQPGLVLSLLSFAVKTLFFAWIFIWVRWTLPRFRYDQLMHLGWKVLFPLSLGNFLVHAYLMSGRG